MMEELDFKGDFHIPQGVIGHNATLIHTDVHKNTTALEMEKKFS